jgi:hypothetical protein
LTFGPGDGRAFGGGNGAMVHFTATPATPPASLHR